MADELEDGMQVLVDQMVGAINGVASVLYVKVMSDPGLDLEAFKRNLRQAIRKEAFRNDTLSDAANEHTLTVMRQILSMVESPPGKWSEVVSAPGDE